MLAALQWYIAATIGFASMVQLSFELPPLLVTASQFLLLDSSERIPFLVNLWPAFQGVDPGDFEEYGWTDAWWEELPTSSFPERTVSAYYWPHQCMH